MGRSVGAPSPAARERDGFAGRDEFTLALPPEPEYVGVARLFAASVARHFGCDSESVEDLKVAVSEACTNSIKAHRDASVGEPVRIVVRLDGDALRFQVFDVGGGFDAPPPPADSVTPPLGLFEGSLGLTLIRSLFPDTEIARNAEGGTTVRFSLLLPAGRADPSQ